MSEFKLVGDKYVSQWNGNSLNTGDATSPYAHPADAASTANLIIIGTGVYNGSWVGLRVLKADGKVVVNFLSSTGGIGSTANPPQEGVYFKNLVGGFGADQATWKDCMFESMNYLGCSTSGIGFTRCNFIGGSAISVRVFRHFNCMMFCDVIQQLGGNVMSFSFLDKNATLIGFTGLLFTNCCLNGKIRFGGTDYELKKLIDGTIRPDADVNIPDIIGVYANVYINGNFASPDPKFIDVLNRIVEPDSDLLKRSNADGFIGGVRSGKRIAVNASDPDITITTTDIDNSDPQNWIIQSPATEGFINIIWRLSDNISEVQRIFLDALLQFDGSEVGGSVGNNNVPDNFPASYSPLSQAGLKPNRLLYEFRTSQSIAKPTTDAQWDNDNVALGTTAGVFYLQEWNTKPTITTILGVAYGNGNPESIGGSNNGINARWGHAKIRLTNNRAF